MDLINSFLNLVLPPACMVMVAFAWPTLSALHAAEWIYRSLTSEDMESKVVIVTGASSAMGEVTMKKFSGIEVAIICYVTAVIIIEKLLIQFTVVLLCMCSCFYVEIVGPLSLILCGDEARM